jgi:diguanylate cyclase (GGDEF)-like protein
VLENINARTRIVLVVLASALPMLALALYDGLHQRREAEAGERKQLRLIAELTAKRPAQVIDGAHQLLFAMTRNVDDLLAGREACQAYFQPMVPASGGFYHSMGLVLPSGELFCTSAAPAPGASIDLNDRLHFRLAASSGKFAVGEYQIGGVTRRQSINFGYPALDIDHRLRAVLFVSLDLEKFIEQGELRQAGEQQGQGRVVTIIDRNGTVLAQYPGSGARIGEKMPESQVLQQVMNLKSGMFTASDQAGVRRIHAVESVGTNPDGVAPLRVIVSSPEPMIYAEANRALMRTILGAVLVTILMIIVAWYGTSVFVLRPFRALLEMADKVRAGDFTARTGSGGGREEFVRLGAAFDAMAGELQTRDRELKQVLRQLNEQAVTDQLTGLPNRRYLWDVLDAELMRARRKQAPLAVMMLDIDHFKEFNDRRGHEAGDLVLKNVAHALRKVVRGSDIVARHGGEEFVIVLPEATEDVARARAEALRDEIAELRLTYGGAALEAITVSVGIAVSTDLHESAEELVRAADDAMYEAKHAGRDRVVFRKT